MMHCKNEQKVRKAGTVSAPPAGLLKSNKKTGTNNRSGF